MASDYDRTEHRVKEKEESVIKWCLQVDMESIHLRVKRRSLVIDVLSFRRQKSPPSRNIRQAARDVGLDRREKYKNRELKLCTDIMKCRQ